MRPADGGTRVLIDPSTLKASAGRLKGAGAELQLVQSALGDLVVPDMPGGVAAAVQSGLRDAGVALSGDPELLNSAVTELTRRAFLAEYADRMMAGYPLSGTAKKEFVAWMKDGTLLQYADDTQGEAAGRELAKLYGGFRDDPHKLIDLAACLKGAEQWGTQDVERAFGAGFVNEFGAKNMQLVPRVIQAMEWSRAIDGSIGTTPYPHVLEDVARTWGDEELHQNPLTDLLAPFSMALANATMSGQLTRTTEDGIADDSDTWATAALVSSGVFSKEFLLKVFRTGVVDKIAESSKYDSMGGLAEEQHDAPYSIGRMWSHDNNGGLPYDSKQIVLDALARNPDAAAAALTQHLEGVQATDRFGERQDVTNSLDLLYHYGHFEDHGSAFGNVYAAAADHLSDSPDTKLEGTQLTQHALGLMLGGGDDLNGFKDGIATDLAHNHMPDLFEAAGSRGSGGEDSITIHDGKLFPSAHAAIEIYKSLGDQPSALQTLLHAGAAEQAAIVHDGAAAGPNGSTAWAHRVGSFDAQVLAGGDLQRIDHFDAEDKRHQLIVGFVKNVLDDTLAVDNPILGAAAHTGVDSFVDSAFPGPEAEKTIFENFDAKTYMQNALHAQVVAGYHDHGFLKAPQDLQTDDGRLVSYGSTDGDQRSTFESWMNDGDRAEPVARNAYDAIDRAFNENDVDLFR
jgi:hypothetical protein